MLHLLSVTLEELYSGCFKKVSVTRKIICNICTGTLLKIFLLTFSLYFIKQISGSGARNGRKPARCVTCNGMGRRMWQQGPQFIPNPHMASTQVMCEACNGLGEIIQQNDKCVACGGAKTMEEKKIMRIEIEKGMIDGILSYFVIYLDSIICDIIISL